MAIDVTDLNIQDSFGNAITDFPLSNVGDKLTIEQNITVSEFVNSSSDEPVIANYTQGVILGGGYWLHDPSGRFEAFKIGDQMEEKNNSTGAVVFSPINIIDKLDNFTIKIDVDIAVGFNDLSTTGAIFNLLTPITAMKYFYNFIENTASNNYASKVDGSIQRLLADSILCTQTQTSGVLIIGQKYYVSDFNAGDDFVNVGGLNVTGTIFTATGTTPTVYANGSTLNRAYDMEFQGAKPYQTGSAIIVMMGLDTTFIYGQKFKIIHYTKVTPFFLTDQYTDLQSGINPVYFQNTECLKYIQKIEAYYNYNDPNRILTYESSEDINLNLIGNTGGFNENFNSGITNYSIDSITYSSGTELELTTNETQVAIIVKNTTDTPFSNNNTKFTLNFIRAPFDATEYQNNTKTLDQNFTFDTALNTVGSAAVNGDTYGTIWQVLKDVSATFTNSGQIVINAKFAFDANVLNEISGSDEFRYIIWVSVQNHTLVTGNSDRVALLADINTFFVDASDPGLVDGSTLFVAHPYTDADIHGTTKLSVKVEDEVCAYSRFWIDKLGRESDTIVITSVISKIVARNSNDDEFTLDSYSLNMSNMPIYGGNQYVNELTPRAFHIAESIRKDIKVVRRTDLDNSSKYYYDVQFPFMVRWEDWILKNNVNGDFFNTSELNNGLNNEWFRFANGLVDDWNVYHELTVSVTKNGTPLQYSFSKIATIGDYQKLVGDSIKTFDPTFTTELYNAVSARHYLNTTSDTGLQAIFAMDSGYSLSGCFVAFHIETYQGNGRDEVRRYSSVNVQASDTYFESISGNDLIDLAKPSALVLRARCLISSDLIPPATTVWRVSARLYYVDPPLTALKRKEDGTVKETEQDIDKRIE